MFSVAILGASGYGGGELLRWLSTHPGRWAPSGAPPGPWRATLRGRPPQPQGPGGGPLRGGHPLGRIRPAPGSRGVRRPAPRGAGPAPAGTGGSLGPGRHRRAAAPGGPERGLPAEGRRGVRSGLRRGPPLPGAPGPVRLRPARMEPGGTGRAPGASPRPAASPPPCSWPCCPCGAWTWAGWPPAPPPAPAAAAPAPRPGTHHPLRAGDFRAYKVLNHQHLAEVRAGMAAMGISGRLAFVPQSAPMVRGIFAALQFAAAGGAGPGRAAGPGRGGVPGRPAGAPGGRIAPGGGGGRQRLRRPGGGRPGRQRRGAGRHRQPGQGHGRPGGPEHEPGLGPAGDPGAADSRVAIRADPRLS